MTTPDLPMRERIAEALYCENHLHVTPWALVGADVQGIYLARADAALAVLATPVTVRRDDLPRLAQGTVLRLNNGALAEVDRLNGHDSLVLWCDGWSHFRDVPDPWLPATVLHTPAALADEKEARG